MAPICPLINFELEGNTSVNHYNALDWESPSEELQLWTGIVPDSVNGMDMIWDNSNIAIDFASVISAWEWQFEPYGYPINQTQDIVDFAVRPFKSLSVDEDTCNKALMYFSFNVEEGIVESIWYILFTQDGVMANQNYTFDGEHSEGDILVRLEYVGDDVNTQEYFIVLYKYDNAGIPQPFAETEDGVCDLNFGEIKLNDFGACFAVGNFDGDGVTFFEGVIDFRKLFDDDINVPCFSSALLSSVAEIVDEPFEQLIDFEILQLANCNVSLDVICESGIDGDFEYTISNLGIWQQDYELEYELYVNNQLKESGVLMYSVDAGEQYTNGTLFEETYVNNGIQHGKVELKMRLRYVELGEHIEVRDEATCFCPPPDCCLEPVCPKYGDCKRIICFPCDKSLTRGDFIDPKASYP